LDTGFVTSGAAVGWEYLDVISDADLFQSNPLNLANDAPVTSTLQIPVVTTLKGVLTPVAPFMPITVLVNDLNAVFVPGQIVDIGTPANLEQVYVVTGGTGVFTGCIQLPHVDQEPVQVFSIPAQPVNLCALAYGQIYMAGDPNNPHFLYYTPIGYPE